jgi:predicted ATPase/class 3 adenylate cyclase
VTAGLPSGTVTFFFTDMEGSTALLQALGDRRYAETLETCRRILREVTRAAGGHEINVVGDAYFAAFPRAGDGLRAAVDAQRRILTHAWPGGGPIRLRMGLDTGEAMGAEMDYVGIVVHRAARICAVGHGGQILVSGVTRDLIEEDLPPGVALRDLGRHRLKDLAHAQHLFQVVADGVAADFPPLRSLDARLNNLPLQLTGFVGREREKAEVRRLLLGSRLLTLTGAGGAGKTRLALQVAAETVEEFADGVWLVELAALSDPALVPHAMAAALNETEQPGRSIEDTLASALRDRQALLVLDNCEHLVAKCAHLSEALLRDAPRLRILATSREALGVAGEVEWQTPPLSLPPIAGASAEALTESESVRLFVARAAAGRPGFAVNAPNAQIVGQICRRLDGIPLAIELAAALVRVLSVEQIAARLDDRFQLLTRGSRTALPHHQTLAATMDWSYQLLSETERALLRRLSVFAGGWTLDAAEAICAHDGLGTAGMPALHAQLAAKSLLIVEDQDGETRYRLLETIREYAQDRLVEAGEAAAMRARHRDWYLALAERAQPDLRGPGQGLWLERLETEHDNFRSALEWSATDEGGTDEGLRLAGALRVLWHVHGHFTEGRGWLQTMLARSPDAPAAARADARAGAALLAYRQGDHDGATALFEESLVLFRSLGDSRGTAHALQTLGQIAVARGDLERAGPLLEEALEWCRRAGDNRVAAMALNTIGEVARCRGDYEGARASYEAGLALRREVGDRSGLAVSLGNLGHIALHEGNARRAALLFREALELARELRHKLAAAEYLSGLAGVAVAEGQPVRAARLLGAADGLLSVLGAPLSPPDAAEFEESKAATRAGLPDAAFQAAWAEGRAMPWERAVGYALERTSAGSA